MRTWQPRPVRPQCSCPMRNSARRRRPPPVRLPSPRCDALHRARRSRWTGCGRRWRTRPVCEPPSPPGWRRSTERRRRRSWRRRRVGWSMPWRSAPGTESRSGTTPGTSSTDRPTRASISRPVSMPCAAPAPRPNGWGRASTCWSSASAPQPPMYGWPVGSPCCQRSVPENSPIPWCWDTANPSGGTVTGSMRTRWWRRWGKPGRTLRGPRARPERPSWSDPNAATAHSWTVARQVLTTWSRGPECRSRHPVAGATTRLRGSNLTRGSGADPTM